MPQYIAFLRAINLGATRVFPKADVQRVTASTGATDVATHLNTGNVRLTSPRRSVAAVRADLERAYAADRGFDVPTVVLTPAEVAAVADLGGTLRDRRSTEGTHYITLYAVPPPAAAAAAVQALDLPGERCIVAGRAAHALLDGDIHDSTLLRSKEFRALGEGTARTLNVIRTLADRWC